MAVCNFRPGTLYYTAFPERCPAWPSTAPITSVTTSTRAPRSLRARRWARGREMIAAAVDYIGLPVTQHPRRRLRGRPAARAAAATPGRTRGLHRPRDQRVPLPALWLAPGPLQSLRMRERFELVICYDVLQYLEPAQARQAIANLARVCRGALYFGALTREDWRDNCDQSAHRPHPRACARTAGTGANSTRTSASSAAAVAAARRAADAVEPLTRPEVDHARMLKILFLLLNAAKLGPLLKVGGTMLLSVVAYALRLRLVVRGRLRAAAAGARDGPLHRRAPLGHQRRPADLHPLRRRLDRAEGPAAVGGAGGAHRLRRALRRHARRGRGADAGAAAAQSRCCWRWPTRASSSTCST